MVRNTAAPSVSASGSRQSFVFPHSNTGAPIVVPPVINSHHNSNNNFNNNNLFNNGGRQSFFVASSTGGPNNAGSFVQPPQQHGGSFIMQPPLPHMAMPNASFHNLNSAVQQQSAALPPQQQAPQVQPYNQAAIDTLLDLYYKDPVEFRKVVSLDTFRSAVALPHTVFEEVEAVSSFDRPYNFTQDEISSVDKETPNNANVQV